MENKEMTKEMLDILIYLTMLNNNIKHMQHSIITNFNNLNNELKK